MKILLFSPYYSFPEKNYVFHRASIPYNLLYISSYLEKYGYNSAICDLGILNESEKIVKDGRVRCGIPDHRLRKVLAAARPDIVGISSMFTIFHHDLVEIIRTIKDFDKDIHVVVGGNHASCFPGLILESGADQVVVGEGERAFLSIVNGNTDKIVKRPLIEDLDDIPIPRMSHKAFKAYSEVHNPFIMNTPVTGIISSRGCPNDCIYCTVNGVWQRKWRGRSPENVVDEMEIMVKEYGVREFHFLDDNVSVDRQRFDGLLDEMIERKLHVSWATPMAYWTLTKDLLKKMKRAGCYRLSFGIESGDLQTREFIGKIYPLAMAKEMIKYANSVGLWTITTNIIGFPYETRKQIQNTVDFAKDCEADFACFFNLIPHASSRVYPYFIKEKLFKETDDLTAIMNEGGCDTLHFKAAELKVLQTLAYKEFIMHKIKFYLTHPLAIINKIKSWQDLFYVLKLVWLGAAMAYRSITTKISTTSKDFIYGKRQYV